MMELESSSSPLASNVEEFQENGRPYPLSRKLRVTFLASEWGSTKGGLSTVNRELAINLAKDPKVDVTFFVPRCNDEDKKTALTSHKIDLVKATWRPGFEDELELLNFPPRDLQIDLVVGNGVKLGHQAQVIRDSHKCKWVQVVHTAPEELGMYKTYSNPISNGQKKHETEVKLCEMADFVVTIGPNLSEKFRAYLRGCKQMVFEFTPGILAEFCEVEQVVDERKKFRVLVFGRGDAEDFLLKGFDIAAKAVAELNDCHLLFVGAPDGKEEEITKRFLECGISAKSLTVRSYLESRESLKKLLCEADLAVMPSRTEGFGLTGLEALSAGLPILVSGNSGFGEALSKVPFGSLFVIDSEDAKVWTKAIKDVWCKERRRRLQESELLRTAYEKEYSWEKQSKDLIDRMVSMAQDAPVGYHSSTKRRKLTEPMEHDPGILPMVINIDSVTFQKAKSRDSIQQEEAKRLIMSEMTKCFVETHAAGIPSENYLLCLNYYLKGVMDLTVREASEGSLRITVECSTLEILENLWEDYCSGHLNEVAEECLLTDDIKRRFDVESVKLETTILKEDYLDCKLFLTGISQMNQDSTMKKDNLWLQDQAQADNETQIQAAEDPEPINLHLAVNYGGNLANVQRENRAQQEDERQQLVSKEVLDTEIVNIPVDELPQYFQHVNVIHNPTTRDASDNSLRIAVECNNLESLERLWSDYRSGHLNAVAEKCLVTDDIKRRFHVQSVNLETTILEDDYLACKEFLLNKPHLLSPCQTGPTPIKGFEETETLDTEETLIQSAEETKKLTVKHTETQATDKTQIQSAGETQTQAADESEATEQTRTEAAEEMETRAMNESQIQCAGETQTLAADENETLATEETQIPSPKEVRTQASETLVTEETQIHFQKHASEETEMQAVEEIRSPDTEETELLILDDSVNPTLDNDALSAHSFYEARAPKIKTTLTHLDLRGKTIGVGSAHDLSEALKVNTVLTTLNVSDNNIGNDGARFLSEALKVNTVLTTLNVSDNNSGDDGARFLSEALKVNTVLTNLNVSDNNIGSNGAHFLSMALKVNTVLTSLDVSYNDIGNDGACFLSKALKVNDVLTNLNVSDNNIGSNGAHFLSKALKVNTVLTSLDVSNNDIGNDGARFLSEALKVNTVLLLTSLNVRYNDIGNDGARFLSEALKVNTVLTGLNVTYNYIGDDGARFLSEALKVNTVLTSLDVSMNNIGNDGARFLSEALKVNTVLTTLNVSDNNIGDDGARFLSETLKVNTVLTSLNVTYNHIGNDGARFLSKALKVNTVRLTSLNVRYNNIGGDGARFLYEAQVVNKTLTNLKVYAEENIKACCKAMEATLKMRKKRSKAPHCQEHGTESRALDRHAPTQGDEAINTLAKSATRPDSSTRQGRKRARASNRKSEPLAKSATVPDSRTRQGRKRPRASNRKSEPLAKSATVPDSSTGQGRKRARASNRKSEPLAKSATVPDSRTQQGRKRPRASNRKSETAQSKLRKTATLPEQ